MRVFILYTFVVQAWALSHGTVFFSAKLLLLWLCVWHVSLYNEDVERNFISYLTYFFFSYCSGAHSLTVAFHSAAEQLTASHAMTGAPLWLKEVPPWAVHCLSLDMTRATRFDSHVIGAPRVISLPPSCSFFACPSTFRPYLLLWPKSFVIFAELVLASVRRDFNWNGA